MVFIHFLQHIIPVIPVMLHTSHTLQYEFTKITYKIKAMMP